jgi:hypothetical protein
MKNLWTFLMLEFNTNSKNDHYPKLLIATNLQLQFLLAWQVNLQFMIFRKISGLGLQLQENYQATGGYLHHTIREYSL